MDYILQIFKKTGKCRHKRNSERVLITTVAVEKQRVLHIMRVFVALVIQQGNSIFSAPHYIVICGLPDSTIFFHIISNGRIFVKKKLLNMKYECRFSPQLLSETFLILGRNELDIIINVQTASSKAPVISARVQ